MKKISHNKTVWTIGHSTRTLEELVEMVHSFQIEMVVDIRSYPGSRRYPQFNKEALEISLPENNIQYFHLKNLGGRRKVNPDSKNTAWRHLAFRGYADYMETDAFKEGIKDLEKIALKQQTAYMCSEAVWWRCPLYGFRLFKSAWMESDAHNGCWKRRGTSLHSACENCKWRVEL